MAKTKILFIINPISGGKSKETVAGLVKKWLNADQFEPEFKYTEYINHATLLAEEAIAKDYSIITAVGGDGTINEVARVVCGSNKAMAIIPYGSGNGLARFLNIPMNTADAVKIINRQHVTSIDSALLNGRPFFNIAGIGFDAHISNTFARNKRRGLSSYAKIILVELYGYRSLRYKLTIDGQLYEENALAISIANSSQYGNNVQIAPRASITDGILDVCIIKPFPFYKLPLFVYRVLIKSAEKTGMIKVIKGMDIEISGPETTHVHLDGEPLEATGGIKILVKPLSLNVIVPQ